MYSVNCIMDDDIETDCPETDATNTFSPLPEESLSDDLKDSKNDSQTLLEEEKGWENANTFCPVLQQSLSEVSADVKDYTSDSQKLSGEETEKGIKDVKEEEETLILCTRKSIKSKKIRGNHRQRKDTKVCNIDDRTKQATMQHGGEIGKLYIKFVEIWSIVNIIKVRIFFDVRDDLKNNISDKTVTTYGSMAEGIVLPNSKIDIMYTLNWVVIQYQPSISSHDLTSSVLLADPCRPGYVDLIILSGWEYELISTCRIERNGKWYLSSSMFQAYMKKQSPPTCTGVGFRFTDVDESFTYAFALESEWPTKLKGLFSREECKGWISEVTGQKIERDGVTLVPDVQKGSDRITTQCQWKILFIKAETTLVRTFTHIQILVLAFLKLHISSTLLTHFPSDVIPTSYLVKTTMFWVMEEIGDSQSNVYGFSSLIMACCKKLFYFLSRGFLPNYFNVDDNLLEYTKNIHASLAACLPILSHTDVASFIFNQEHNNVPDTINLFPFAGSDWDPIILSLLPLIQASYHNNSMLKMIKKMLVNNHSRFIQSLYGFLLSQQSQSEAQNIIVTNGDNKISYRQQRSRLSLLLIGSYSDTLSGWILLAFHFLNVGNFTAYSEIITYLECKRRTTADMMISYQSSKIPLSFLQKIRFRYVKPALRIKGSHLIPLAESTSSIDYSLIQSDVLLHYLKFLLLMNTGYETMCPELLIQARERHAGYSLSKGMSEANEMVFATMERMLKDNDHKF